MKVKLDENMPAEARPLVASYDHDVDTVVEEGLAGRTDDEVTSAAVREGRIIITLDLGVLGGCVVVVRGHLVRVRRPE